MQLPDLLDLRALNYFTVDKKFIFVVGCRSGILLVKEFLLSWGFPSMTSFLNYTAPAPKYSLHGLAHLGQHNTSLKRYSSSSKARK
jgi:hypothetical protein